MTLHLNNPTPAAVARALDMAVHLPTEDARRLRVQVVSREGYLLAAGVLQGFEQAAFLRDQLQILGDFDLVPPKLAEERGCDVMLKEAYVKRDAIELLLPPSSTAWPPRTLKMEAASLRPRAADLMRV